MRFWGDKQNFNGKAPAGESSALATKDSADNALSAAPSGAGGLTARFTQPPPTVVGLALDFNADSIAGADGSAPSRWVDSTGNSVAATVAAGTPILKTGAAGISGHNVVRFATSGVTPRVCYFSATVDPRAWAGLTVYYVARSGSGSANSAYGGVFGWQGTGQWINCGLGVGDGTNQGAGWAGPGGGAVFGNVTGFAPGNVFTASYRYDKTAWTIEGVESATIPDTSSPAAVMTALIGSNTFTRSQSDNDVTRILVYNRKLTDVEDAQVMAYLAFFYGGAAAANVLQVGYPETLTNLCVERYVHPWGDDANDGKTRQTAKKTILGAWDSAVNEPGTLEMHVTDGSYVGGEAASQGFWVNRGTAAATGWRSYRPFRIIGHGGFSPGVGFTRNQARIFRGQPGDPQTYDKAKPYLWIFDTQTEATYDSLSPANGLDGVRIGVKNTSNGFTDRDGLVSNARWINVTGASPPDTAGSWGAAWDIGWANICWLDTCLAIGSATGTTSPSAINDDNHAGVLIRPSGDTSGNGPPGNTGLVYMQNLSTSQCGLKVYVGSQGLGFYLNALTTENAPMPYPVQITTLPGAYTQPLSFAAFNAIEVTRVIVADVARTGQPYDVWIDPVLWPTIKIGNMAFSQLDGAVYGPGTLPTFSNSAAPNVATTPLAMGQCGFFDGYVVGRSDVGRRLGAPAVALPISDGNTGPTNLVTHDQSLWSAAGGAVFTANTADIFGGLNAATLLGGSFTGTENVVITANRALYGSGTIAVSLTTGDFVIAGLIARSPTGPLDTPVARISLGVGSFATAAVLNVARPMWEGNSEAWACIAYDSVVETGTVATRIDFTIPRQPVDIRISDPFLILLKAADGWTRERVAELANAIQSWNPPLAQGVAGTRRKQPFVASGGWGMASTVPVSPSGTASPTKNVPLLSDDGTTVQGYLPLLPTNSNLPAGTVTSVGFTAPLKNTGSSTAVVGAIDDFVASGASHARGAVPDPGATPGITKFLREDATFAVPPGVPPDAVSVTLNGSSQLQRAALTGEAVAASGSNAVKVLRQLVYYGTYTPATASGWIVTSNASAVTGATPSEYPLGIAASAFSVDANVIANTLSGGPTLVTSWFVTQNGANVGGTGNIANGTTGAVHNGPVAVGGGATSDTWGVNCTGTGAPSGAITIAIVVTVFP